jgi:hypothetical protein
MDSYDLQARHAPVLFAALPIILVALALVPGLGDTKFQAGSIGLLLLLALGFVATRLARSAGRARQDQLYALWGGMPTTAMLRFSDARLNPQTKKIYRDRLARLGPSFPIPDEEEERRDAAGADIKIGAAMDEVRRRAKEKGVKSVHRENINFGAARNAFGLKPFGLGACAIAVVFLAGAILIRAPLSITPLDIVVAMAIVVIAAIWLLACTADRVRHHGEGYALALFEAIEGLVQAPRRNTQPRATTERRPKSE